MAAITNHDRIGKTLDLLRQGITPFIKRELESVIGDGWRKQVVDQFPQNHLKEKELGTSDAWDAQVALGVMWNDWNTVFKRTLGHAERSLVSELKLFRNDWAHQKQFSFDDAHRCMDSAERLLSSVSAPQAELVRSEKDKLLREKFEQQRRDEKKKLLPGLDGAPIEGLKSWREIMTPHEDVASGKFQQAEFAADLWQVYQGKGKAEYADPVHFFRRTYMTEGLGNLLTNALERVCGQNGDPIVELQTNFGGGKTHSMLGLYHLFSGTPFAELPGVEDLIRKAQIKETSLAVRRAVLVGTRLQPGQPMDKPDGTRVHTLWGELAWQLGGKEGYAMVEESDRNATSPGSALHDVIETYSPCLILVDEWVAYARQLSDDRELCGGSFETQFTFAQTLTETVKGVDHAMLVVSIPASDFNASPHYQTKGSDIEIGGEKGMQALHRLKNVVGRTESSWRPASQEESYAIVRRRLFDDLTDAKLFKQRDVVLDAFHDMYGKQAQEFPTECREAEYRRRMQECYPIHPELFDRLYNEWSSLERFQRTRGVLRLMASVIHALWDRQDASLMILPASIPLDNAKVRSELTTYLDQGWESVLDRDVDGPHAISRRMDSENPNMGRYSACRRVSRTVFMASAPVAKAAHKGADDAHVKLGCVQPGEAVATFGDALRRLGQQAMHLYVDDHRFWFNTQPTVQRLARDRATDMKADRIEEELNKRLREEERVKGYFVRIHAAPNSSADIPDEPDVRLVVLDTQHAHRRNQADSPALSRAKEFLEQRGTNPRHLRNTLVFLAADSGLMQSLMESVALYLAWDSINREKGEDGLALDPHQARQVETQLKESSRTVGSRLLETYCWLLVPHQTEKTQREIEWQTHKLGSQQGLVERCWKRLVRDEAVYERMGWITLLLEIDKVPLWEGNHCSLSRLIDSFTKYLYLPRLKSPHVLEEAIQDGISLLQWDSESFAVADGYDEEKGRYVGLVAGSPRSVHLTGGGMVVKREIAKSQLETPGSAGVPPASSNTHDPANPPQNPTGSPDDGADTGGDAGGTPTLPGEPDPPKRFYATVKLDPERLTRDASKIAEEVVQHLTKKIMSDVEITLEIQAKAPEGYDKQDIRTLTENCTVLKFDAADFEEN